MFIFWKCRVLETHTKDKEQSVESLLPTLSPHGDFPAISLWNNNNNFFKQKINISTRTQTRLLWNRNTKIAKPEQEKQKYILYSYCILASFMGLIKLLTLSTINSLVFLIFFSFLGVFWFFGGFLLEVGGCITCWYGFFQRLQFQHLLGTWDAALK